MADSTFCVDKAFQDIDQHIVDRKCGQVVYDVCDCLGEGKQFFQLTNALEDNSTFLVLCTVSAMMNALFFFLMWWIKELRVHPMRLFMYMMALDAWEFY